MSEMREDPRFPGTLIHESSYVDDDSTIGRGTKIWHFSHILARTTIGENCSIGQNVMIGPNVRIGNGCKIQNNVSIYDGVALAEDVFCGPSCVFTNVNNPRADVSRKDEFRSTPSRPRVQALAPMRPSSAGIRLERIASSAPARWLLRTFQHLR